MDRTAQPRALYSSQHPPLSSGLGIKATIKTFLAVRKKMEAMHYKRKKGCPLAVYGAKYNTLMIVNLLCFCIDHFWRLAQGTCSQKASLIRAATRGRLTPRARMPSTSVALSPWTPSQNVGEKQTNQNIETVPKCGGFSNQ